MDRGPGAAADEQCLYRPRFTEGCQLGGQRVKIQDTQAILPGGDGLKRTGRLLKAGLVTDGPYVEAKEIIVSFGVIQAADYDAAVAIARACPPGHTIEIRELAGYA